jgi:hypothetical protein
MRKFGIVAITRSLAETFHSRLGCPDAHRISGVRQLDRRSGDARVDRAGSGSHQPCCCARSGRLKNGTADERWTVVVRLNNKPEREFIDSVIARLQDFATTCFGEFDGWEAALTR